MKSTSLHIDPERRRFHALIGTGGIGSGALFLLSGNHTLGREESRGGRFLDARDYCKLHIIAHNVKMLCGESFPVYPVGKIGDDDVGRRIFHEMEEAGLMVDYVQVSPGDSTLFGFCFLYPDGTGGNLTTEVSACNKVDAAQIEEATPLLSKFKGSFVSLCAPEVPLSARRRLLELTRAYGGYAVASFTSGELGQAKETGMLNLVDLIALNKDEAAALVGVSSKADAAGIASAAVERMVAMNPSACVSVTAGREGCWGWDGKKLVHTPVVPVSVKSSAGAGDAHISAVISGLAAGLTFHQAQVLGNLAGALAATSPHTIHPEMGREALLKLAVGSGLALDSPVTRLLKENAETNTKK